MKNIAFFDAKSYDRHVFDKLNTKYEISYFKNKLNHHTARFARGYDAVCAFVNDDINEQVIEELYDGGIQVIAMRCAGYSNIDFSAVRGKMPVVRVPAYSPYAVAEFAMGLLLSVNRKIHRAYDRTRNFNFSIVKLEGTDLYGKTAGVIGTGKIGRVFIDICRGFGMKVIAYDLYPAKDSGIEYVELDTLLRESDVISLHCPLTETTHHIIDEHALSLMKEGAFLLNTSRGSLVDSEALLAALKKRKLGGVALDVYEEEANFFYEDMSQVAKRDENLAFLLSFPNVLITSHQAYLTKEALFNIADVTLKNLDEFFNGEPLTNEVIVNGKE
ncbi:MAG: 2-hydroxyacid dehydrogenase [Lachnospiraceae bacterium]|nr:2-hydroxyacid dehydrogenase [Lachnospiraceae bacterium]